MTVGSEFHSLLAVKLRDCRPYKVRTSDRARQFLTKALVTVDTLLELQRKLNSESCKQPRICSEHKTNN